MSDDLHIGSAVARTSQATLMDKDWCALTWGPWVPLERQAVMRIGHQLMPGVYRIRRQGGAGNRLVYIGQTGGHYGIGCSPSPPALTPRVSVQRPSTRPALVATASDDASSSNAPAHRCRRRADSSRDRGHAALAASGSDRIIDRGKLRPLLSRLHSPDEPLDCAESGQSSTSSVLKNPFPAIVWA